MSNIDLESGGIRQRNGFRKRINDFWQEPNIENNRTQARDHLANERTFLSGARTALQAFTAGNAVINRGVDILAFNMLGNFLIVLSAGIVLYAAYRNNEVKQILYQGKFTPEKRWFVLFTIIYLLLIGFTLGINYALY
jgi:uncharacterized membrane protein YidH (DUF202 family)